MRPKWFFAFSHKKYYYKNIVTVSNFCFQVFSIVVIVTKELLNAQTLFYVSIQILYYNPVTVCGPQVMKQEMFEATST